MNPASEDKIRVLLVDDDRSFLEMVQQAFTTLSQGSWEILLATEAATTSRLLKQQPVDLVVLDMRMPEISGLQLISILNREYPSLLKVFLTGVAGEEERVAGLESGAALCLEKPMDLTGLQSIFATLNELVKWHRRQGSRGTPRAAGLLDIVKLECTSANSRLFEVSAEGVRGLIYIKEGSIIHAESPGRRGQSAFTHLATLPGADFNLRQFVEPPERSVYRQWEFLFLEAVQLQEQLQQAAAEAKAKETAPVPAPTPAPPAEPASAPRKASAKRAPAEPPANDATAVFQRHRRLTESGPPPSAPAEETAMPGLAPPAAPPVPARPATPTTPEPLQLRLVQQGPGAALPTEDRQFLRTAPAGPVQTRETSSDDLRILEIVVCSNQGELLYDWQSDRPEARLELVQVVRGQFDRVSQHLPVGQPDRLEVQTSRDRLVIQYQAEGAILLASNSGSSPVAGGSASFHQSLAGWLARHANLRGLLASGVIRPGQNAVSQSCSREYPREPLSPVWRGVQEVLGELEKQSYAPWQLRWLFEHAQLYVARRADGKSLAVFLTKDPAALDAEAVERLFNEFKTLEAS